MSSLRLTAFTFLAIVPVVACNRPATQDDTAGATTKATADAAASARTAGDVPTANAAGAAQGNATAAEAAQPSAIPAPPDVAAPPADAVRSASGLASKMLKPGTSKEKPSASAYVTVNYTGWTTDGRMFDSSVTRGEPATFPLEGVIKGWTEGVQLMTVGEQRRFWIPSNLAYGDNPGGGRPAGMLVFDIELLSMVDTPADVAAPPRDAKKTASGLAYKVISPGTGKVHPTAESMVEVHYSGWQTDGKMFDSSVVRGKPARFPLNRVIPGWTEGVQLMVEGQKTRFWIPAKLAYGDDPASGKPTGMLVFDVTLLKILP